VLAEASLLVALSVQHGVGTEACIEAPQLVRGVERRLKRRVFVDAAQAELRFTVTFERHGAQTEARIDVTNRDGSARGSRSLITSSHCSALDDSLALSVALLVDQAPEPESEAKSRPVTKPPITIPAEVAAPREPWHAGLGAGLGGTWGVLADAVPNLGLYFMLAPRHFYPVFIEAEVFPPASFARDATSGARLSLVRLGLLVCPPLLAGSGHALGLCVGQRLGSLRIEGYGFDHDADERRFTYALVLALEPKLRLSERLWLRGYGGVEIPLVRDEIASAGRNAASLARPWPVAAVSQFGVEAAIF